MNNGVTIVVSAAEHVAIIAMSGRTYRVDMSDMDKETRGEFAVSMLKWKRRGYQGYPDLGDNRFDIALRRTRAA